MLTQAANIPPIVRTAERLLVYMETLVRGFSRYHKYTLGSELRTQCMSMVKLCHKAWRDKVRTLDYLQQLVWLIDESKLSLQLAKQLQAFRSFAQFSQVAELLVQLGKQCGGWIRHQQANGQKPVPTQAQARPNRLSSQATPEVSL